MCHPGKDQSSPCETACCSPGDLWTAQSLSLTFNRLSMHLSARRLYRAVLRPFLKHQWPIRVFLRWSLPRQATTPLLLLLPAVGVVCFWRWATVLTWPLSSLFQRLAFNCNNAYVSILPSVDDRVLRSTAALGFSLKYFGVDIRGGCSIRRVLIDAVGVNATTELDLLRSGWDELHAADQYSFLGHRVEKRGELDDASSLERRERFFQQCLSLSIYEASRQAYTSTTGSFRAPGGMLTSFPPLFNKLGLWRMTQFKKIIYVEHNTLLVQELDHLFDGPQSGSVTAAQALAPASWFSTSLLVLQPMATKAEELTSGLADMVIGGQVPSPGCNEVVFLNQAFPDWDSSDLRHRLGTQYASAAHSALWSSMYRLTPSTDNTSSKVVISRGRGFERNLVLATFNDGFYSELNDVFPTMETSKVGSLYKKRLKLMSKCLQDDQASCPPPPADNDDDVSDGMPPYPPPPDPYEFYSSTFKYAANVDPTLQRGRYACMTFIKDNDVGFLRGAAVLGESLLATNSACERTVMVTPEVNAVSRVRLMHAGWKLREVATFPTPILSCNDTKWGGSNSEWGKLQVFNLTEYDKLLYLDADTLVKQSVDAVFHRPGYPLTSAPGMFPPDSFNAGVMLLSPSSRLYEHMLSRIPVLESYDCGDQGFLQRFFNTWYSLPASHRMPASFNAHRNLIVTGRAHFGESLFHRTFKPIITHLSGKKEWGFDPYWVELAHASRARTMKAASVARRALLWQLAGHSREVLAPLVSLSKTTVVVDFAHHREPEGALALKGLMKALKLGNVPTISPCYARRGSKLKAAHTCKLATMQKQLLSTVFVAGFPLAEPAALIGSPADDALFELLDGLPDLQFVFLVRRLDSPISPYRSSMLSDRPQPTTLLLQSQAAVDMCLSSDPSLRCELAPELSFFLGIVPLSSKTEVQDTELEVVCRRPSLPRDQPQDPPIGPVITTSCGGKDGNDSSAIDRAQVLKEEHEHLLASSHKPEALWDLQSNLTTSTIRSGNVGVAASRSDLALFLILGIPVFASMPVLAEVPEWALSNAATRNEAALATLFSFASQDAADLAAMAELPLT